MLVRLSKRLNLRNGQSAIIPVGLKYMLIISAGAWPAMKAGHGSGKVVVDQNPLIPAYLNLAVIIRQFWMFAFS
jgi:hypothetical protein